MVDPPQRGERVERPVDGHGVEGGRDRPPPARRRPTTTSAPSEPRCSIGRPAPDPTARRRSRLRAGAGAPHPTIDLPVGGAVHEAGGEVRGEDRPGHEGPAELLEHHGGGGACRRPSPPASSGSRNENTPASASSDQPARRCTTRSPSAARILSRGKRPAHSRRMPSASATSSSESSKSMVSPPRPLALGQAEDALGDDVALDLRRPRRDGAREAVHPGARRSRRCRPRPRRRCDGPGDRRRTTSPAAPTRSMPSSAMRWRSSDRASL